MPADLLAMLQSGNRYLDDAKIQGQARGHLQTSGDGNHFIFSGTSESTGETWLVSHHGSRGFGAGVYKKGMEVAERFRKELCPDLDAGHAWIPADSEEGVAYWEALEIVRAWTKVNHALLHEAVVRTVGADVRHQRWNPHNMVFRDPADPSLFWHAKGATPVHNAFLPDTDGTQIIPLNMAQPILFVQGQKTANGFGFAPHGAGRNLSRTQHKKRMNGESDEAIFARETAGIDARFWSGTMDISELPSAYKDADQVQEQMERFGLATVVDRIHPYGGVMAGEIAEPWRLKKAAKAV
jgi:RNA-splicing ligase RtcB